MSYINFTKAELAAAIARGVRQCAVISIATAIAGRLQHFFECKLANTKLFTPPCEQPKLLGKSQ